jgi:hypothetical protein
MGGLKVVARERGPCLGIIHASNSSFFGYYGLYASMPLLCALRLQRSNERRKGRAQMEITCLSRRKQGMILLES